MNIYTGVTIIRKWRRPWEYYCMFLMKIVGEELAQNKSPLNII